MIDISKIWVLICCSGMPGILRMFLFIAALINGCILHLRAVHIERFVIATYCIRSPLWILERRPTSAAIAVVDHNVSNGLYTILQKGLKHIEVLFLCAIAIIQIEVLLRIITRAVFTTEADGWEPNQIKTPGTYVTRSVLHNLIPTLDAVLGESLRMTMSIGFPIKTLKHNAIVVKATLGQNAERKKRNHQNDNLNKIAKFRFHCCFSLMRLEISKIRVDIINK